MEWKLASAGLAFFIAILAMILRHNIKNQTLAQRLFLLQIVSLVVGYYLLWMMR